MEFKEIRETINAASLYLNKLESIENEVSIAQSQILTSARSAEENVDKIFNKIQELILKSLDERKLILKNQIHEIKDSSIKPLSDCKSVVLDKIKQTKDFLKLGDNLVKKENNIDCLRLFISRSSLLGSLPAVPTLNDVPYICFSYENNIEDLLNNGVNNFGEVLKTSPVQIIQMTEKPGGIYIEWQMVDLSENFKDVHEFCLQKAIDNESRANFETCYIGLDYQYLVKDVNVNQSYLFRINCKYEGSNQESPWSIPQSFKTSLKPFSWAISSDNFISVDGKIAHLLKDEPGFLVSDGPQFKIGHTIEFTILEMDTKAASFGIATTDDINTISQLNFFEKSTFILTSDGHIFLEGIEKSTHFPKLNKKSKFAFTSELSKNNKILMHIDLEEKRATYELNVDEICNFFFIANVPTCNWKIMIE